MRQKTPLRKGETNQAAPSSIVSLPKDVVMVVLHNYPVSTDLQVKTLHRILWRATLVTLVGYPSWRRRLGGPPSCNVNRQVWNPNLLEAEFRICARYIYCVLFSLEEGSRLWEAMILATTSLDGEVRLG